MCRGSASVYDRETPEAFQTGQFLYENGHCDCVCDTYPEAEALVAHILAIVAGKAGVHEGERERERVEAEALASRGGPIDTAAGIGRLGLDMDMAERVGEMAYAAQREREREERERQGADPALSVSSLSSPDPMGMPETDTSSGQTDLESEASPGPEETDTEARPDYTETRSLDRVQPQDIVHQLFGQHFVEISGGGAAGKNRLIRAGLAMLPGAPGGVALPCIVTYHHKGHSVEQASEREYGCGLPAGFSLALRAAKLAERLRLPLLTFVDTAGALPSFEAEATGQARHIAACLCYYQTLTVPVVSLVVGEGGSGGALAIAGANRVGILSGAFYSVITPEGAASIMQSKLDRQRRQRGEPVVRHEMGVDHADCTALAALQHAYPEQLLELGVVDRVVSESVDGEREPWGECPVLVSRVLSFLHCMLGDIAAVGEGDRGREGERVRQDRWDRFNALGEYGTYQGGERERGEVIRLRQSRGECADTPSAPKTRPTPPSLPLTDYIAAQTVALGSAYRRDSAHPTPSYPPSVYRHVSEQQGESPSTAPTAPTTSSIDATPDNAKRVLDRDGPEALSKWLSVEAEAGRVGITTTDFRDAHQSLVATRIRTAELYGGAVHLRDAGVSASPSLFSVECWGGATFDVSMRFLKESPWERLRVLRKALPDTCLQMLFRGSNAVGYTGYPDNVIHEFVKVAAREGIDVFRIFDAFNKIDQMRVAIDAVRECNKVAEVCLCFSGDFLSEAETIYTLDYYRDRAREAKEAGAHIIAIKDMAGLVKPQMAVPLVQCIRQETGLPVHFHTHSTGGSALVTCVAMVDAGCAVVDVATCALSGLTSQPPMQSLLHSLSGTPHFTCIDPTVLEAYDSYWRGVRAVYSDTESGIMAPSANVYQHQIPGGQYSNLYQQCKGLGMLNRWDRLLEVYAGVNRVFGNLIKVTPSSKVVGDMALLLVSSGLSPEDILDESVCIDFPLSVRNLFGGKLGMPHHGLPSAVCKRVLKIDSVPPYVRPGDMLPPADMGAERERLVEVFSDKGIESEVRDTDVLSSLLYKQVYDDYLTHVSKYGVDTTRLPCPVFRFGLRPGDSTPLLCLRESDTPATLECIRVTGVSIQGDRAVTVAYAGADGASTTYSTRVTEPEPPVTSCPLPNADPAKKGDIPATVSGTVTELHVTQGQRVRKGDALVSVEGPKIKVSISAPTDGVVSELGVGQGTDVVATTLVAVIG
ncbi:acetyl-CoA carboxylase, alpha subunit [Kipferlia bialata]|uniref:acetyl-CoA carboxytransferase n=1 Tax=Kipferlia bialata TaxID=797122 RepID=A0A9K3CS42_9EUKA|nr:acetyl-CoA carboxylase, alpha subunit [Kipferlia bialata]|eukprot:g1524.t1